MKEKKFHGDYYSPQENQGKKRKQYRDSATFFIWAVIILWAGVLAYVLYETVKNL